MEEKPTRGCSGVYRVKQTLELNALFLKLAYNVGNFALNHHTTKAFMFAGLFAVLGTSVWNQEGQNALCPPPLSLALMIAGGGAFSTKMALTRRCLYKVAAVRATR